MICFGSTLYFKHLLMPELKEAPWFIMSFNDPLSCELKHKQMDFIIATFFQKGKSIMKISHLIIPWPHRYRRTKEII